MNPWIGAVVLGSVVFAAFGLWVARQKQRSAYEGLLIGALFGPLGVLVEAMLPQGVTTRTGGAFDGSAQTKSTHDDFGHGQLFRSFWTVIGIPLALISAAIWGIGVRACGKLLDDFGAELPLLTVALLKYVWPLAAAFGLLASGCLIGVAVSKTPNGVFVSRIAALLVVATYVAIAILGCVPPVMKLISDLS